MTNEAKAAALPNLALLDESDLEELKATGRHLITSGTPGAHPTLVRIVTKAEIAVINAAATKLGNAQREFLELSEALAKGSVK